MSKSQLARTGASMDSVRLKATRGNPRTQSVDDGNDSIRDRLTAHTLVWNTRQRTLVEESGSSTSSPPYPPAWPTMLNYWGRCRGRLGLAVRMASLTECTNATESIVELMWGLFENVARQVIDRRCTACPLDSCPNINDVAGTVSPSRCWWETSRLTPTDGMLRGYIGSDTHDGTIMTLRSGSLMPACMR
ncbi:hypothetical protein L210DRAFT_3506691 [Boletus edulis BED1]|uniref:Uncharacterized protein n=1 Tax=Boletus edulis BED1 TaxID=1328754 RepID=A0AAD4BMK8_BOLED|nr:hypothetical protein L210DRAFT_3506691 [Boletus edulis BED1]